MDNNMTDQNQDFDQEINLAECLAVLIKRKKLILAVFFISLAAAAAINFRKPEVWDISMIIDPGMPVSVDAPGNIKARIESGIFDRNVISALQLDAKSADFKLNIYQPQDSTFLKLSIYEPGNDKALGVRVLNQFFTELTAFYKESGDLKKDAIDKQISVISRSIKNRQNSIKLIKGNLEIAETREQELLNELKETKINAGQLPAKSNAQAVQTSSLRDPHSSNQLNDKLADSKMQKETMMSAAKALQIDISNLGIEIEKLKTAKDSIRNIGMVREPKISQTPVGPRGTVIIVLAAIFGLVSGAVLAFFIESLDKSGKALKS